MAYVFSRTGKDTQIYLRPRYSQNLVDPFLSKKEIINYLSSIYKDPLRYRTPTLIIKPLI